MTVETSLSAGKQLIADSGTGQCRLPEPWFSWDSSNTGLIVIGWPLPLVHPLLRLVMQCYDTLVAILGGFCIDRDLAVHSSPDVSFSVQDTEMPQWP